MRLILDASVALKFGLPEPDSDLALQLRDDFHNGLHELLAPDIFPIEIGHALTKAERQKRISPPDGWAIWQKILADCPILLTSYPLMPRAFEISSAKRMGLYDCLYIALAEQENCNLVTADQKLITNLPGYPVISLSSL